ncbi:hypothetical protein PENTCL1PPCAC_8400, partial [Pristionchus entomophagus]
HYTMLLRLLSIVVLFNVVHAVVENPCKDKLSSLYCHDAAASCAVIFQQTGGEPNPNCFDTTNPDHVFADSCRATCQLCCEEPQFNCDNDPDYKAGCPENQMECNIFSDINYLHCQSSCGWCDKTSKPCFDNLSPPACSNYKIIFQDLCSMPEVSVQCEKTCEVCIPNKHQSHLFRCSIWAANGFCEDVFYTLAGADTKYWKRTCGLC